MIRIAINGYGRIGRNILRAFYERPELRKELEIVAINDQGDVSINTHLTQYDSVHGRFHEPVSHDDNSIIVGEDHIVVLTEKDPAKLPWKELAIDIVFECTGLFTDREKAAGHLAAGAKKVLISAPGKNMDATVVYGINHQTLRPEHQVVSNASCTTNCLAPVVKPLHEAIGIEAGFMTTIHAYTNDQHLVDVYHPDVYRARSATLSMIPTKTGAAKAIGLVLPELAGKLDGIAVRVPTANVSLVDFTFTAKRETTADEVNQIMQEAAKGPLSAILAYTEEPLVSIDFNHTTFSSIFDGTHTRAQNRMVKVLSWYDNEWGFSNRMLDTGIAMFHN
ncbi:MAG: type I glyceraldehyde-3-phosphate dehydrogenase [Gammaproteobacteria bacterium]|nr:MAG: type I glyceraldehyde-3-phosphate dehydrogenase [Gammaproteobacteria bacterium]